MNNFPFMIVTFYEPNEAIKSDGTAQIIKLEMQNVRVSVKHSKSYVTERHRWFLNLFFLVQIGMMKELYVQITYKRLRN